MRFSLKNISKKQINKNLSSFKSLNFENTDEVLEHLLSIENMPCLNKFYKKLASKDELSIKKDIHFKKLVQVLIYSLLFVGFISLVAVLTNSSSLLISSMFLISFSLYSIYVFLSSYYDIGKAIVVENFEEKGEMITNMIREVVYDAEKNKIYNSLQDLESTTKKRKRL